MPDLSEPAAEHRTRLELRKAAFAAARRRDALVANIRLLIFAAFAVLGFLWLRGSAPGLWALAPAVAFFALLIVHERVLRALQRAQRAIAFHERALARIAWKWHGQGEDGARHAAPGHPYAQDLDLFGPDSLFQLLNAARTRAGTRIPSSALRPSTASTAGSSHVPFGSVSGNAWSTAAMASLSASRLELQGMRSSASETASTPCKL